MTAAADANSRFKRLGLAVLLALVALTTAALGVWQVERRTWKLELIANASARAHAVPVPAPGPAEWHAVTAEAAAYRHVTVSGTFDHGRETRVWAVTGQGEGAWLLTPLNTAGGWNVLINRGFVPAGPQPVSRPAGVITVTGLLRVTEPGGAFFRPNRPKADRWYSRDVNRIALARGITAAPYFIDADAASNTREYPLSGLTPVVFRNAHASYAATWFILAALSSGALWFLLRER